MCNQPIYGHCWDNICGDGHTSSRRGIVSEVGLDCYTNYGKCVKVSIGYRDGKELVEKPDLRKVKKEEKNSITKRYDEEVDNKTKIDVEIRLAEDKHFSYSIDGVEINDKILSLLKNTESKKFLMVVDRLLRRVEDGTDN